MKPHKGLLENWYEESYGEESCIWGIFQGHERFNGNYGYTSYIIARDGNEIETLNSRYTLGTPFGELQCSGEHSPTTSSQSTSAASTP